MASFSGPTELITSRSALPARKWVGHHAAEFHADHAALGDMFQRLSKGETIYNYPARLRHKNGSCQNVLIASSVLFDDTGHFVHTRCFTMLAPAAGGKER
jgi:hypothetical protein